MAAGAQRARALRVVCIAETASFLALLVAMTAGSEGGVSVIGAVHGLLFLAYAGLVAASFRDLGWSLATAAVLVLTGPVGAVVCLERLSRPASVSA